MGGRGLHFGVILGVWAGSGSQMRLGRRLGRLLGDFQSQHGPNMAPSWVPRWSQNGEKIDAKIDQKIDAFQDRFLKRFWRICGGKMEASWHQNRSKIDACCETRFFAKSCSPCSGGSKNGVQGVQVGSKNRSKIDQNLKSKMGCLLASIFDAFWSFFGGKLARKIEPRSIQNRSQKASKK